MNPFFCLYYRIFVCFDGFMKNHFSFYGECESKSASV